METSIYRAGASALQRILLCSFALLSSCSTGDQSAARPDSATIPVLDGGSTDGGSFDGGNTDGGSTDGGSTDGGSTDGGSFDGGNTDGGSTDGGSFDGGTSDGGSFDGGSFDGGSFDGGSFDGGSFDGGTSDGGCGNGSQLVISNVLIEDNPNSVLSCYVSWTTNVPATTMVELGTTSSYTHRIAQHAQIVDHRVLVIGLKADTLYHLQARSDSVAHGQSNSCDLTYTTGSLPSPIAECSVPLHDAGEAQSGWTLTDVHYGEYSAAVAYDMSGDPVWYFIVPEIASANLDVALVNDGSHILVGLTRGDEALEVDLAGNITWRGPEIGTVDRAHHHYEKLPDDSYLTVRRKTVNGAIGDVVEIAQPDETVLWSWSVFDHLTPVFGDWTHGNAAIADVNGGWAYFNSRGLSKLFKIDMYSGQIEWELGEGGDFVADPTAAYPWFSAQHAPEVLSNGNILIYDNGNAHGFSRVVEYEIDESLLTADLVWEFPGDATGLDQWYTHQWATFRGGDVDRLANGNTLVSAGASWRTFEITEDRRVVWEMLLPGTHDGMYRSERIPPLLIEEL